MPRSALSVAVVATAAAALCASAPVLADPEAPAALLPAPAVAGPEPSALPAGPLGTTRAACFGGLEDGQPIVRGAASGRFGGTTARACRANGGNALRALRSPSIAAGRPIVA